MYVNTLKEALHEAKCLQEAEQSQAHPLKKTVSTEREALLQRVADLSCRHEIDLYALAIFVWLKKYSSDMVTIEELPLLVHQLLNLSEAEQYYFNFTVHRIVTADLKSYMRYPAIKLLARACKVIVV